MATCLSPLSRNRRVGEEIARGRTVEEITSQLGMVAEGTKSAQSVVEIARQHGVDVPIAEEVAAVVRGERTAQQAYRGLGKVARRRRSTASPENARGAGARTRAGPTSCGCASDGDQLRHAAPRRLLR